VTIGTSYSNSPSRKELSKKKGNYIDTKRGADYQISTINGTSILSLTQGKTIKNNYMKAKICSSRNLGFFKSAKD
jgi:hypothetical protein